LVKLVARPRGRRWGWLRSAPTAGICGGQRGGPRLRASVLRDERVEHSFGDSLREALIVPSGVESPRDAYLRWHHEHVYQDSLP